MSDSPRVPLPHNWKPRPYQLKLWSYLEHGGKRAVAVWHRRSGKDETALHRIACAAHERVGTYWHMLPEANQARRVIWDAINPHTGKKRIDEAFPPEIRAATNQTEMKITFRSGSVYQLAGSDNYNSLVGSAPVGVVFSEWALADPAAWPMIRPILAENGGWALFLYTPRGHNHGLTTLRLAQSEPSWFAQVLTNDDTGVFTTETLGQERRELTAEFGTDQGEALYQQEYFCSFEAAVLGAYYGREMRDAQDQGRIRDVMWDPALPVYTGWDLGIGDSTAIWFAQILGPECRAIDYLENAGVGLDWYAKEIQRRPYAYAQHILPHDADARELGTGRTRRETLTALQLGQLRIMPQQRVDDGINAGRTLIARTWFDRTKAERGIDALRQYRRDYDDKRKTFHVHPRHDWTSHAADAWRTLALGLPALSTPKRPDWAKRIRGPHSAMAG